MKKRVREIVGLLSEGSADGYSRLIQALQTAEGTVRHDAIQAIIDSGERCLPFLTQAMERGDLQLVSSLVWELRKHPRKWAAGPLAIALRSGDLDNRRMALSALAHLDDPAAAGPMTEALTDTTMVSDQAPLACFAEQVPAGEALGNCLLREDHGGTAPILWVAEYLGKFGGAGCLPPLLRSARTGAYATCAFSAMEQVLRRDARCVPDELLLELTRLIPIRNFKFEYDNDDSEDLRTSLEPQGWADPQVLKRLAQAELTRRDCRGKAR